MSINWTQLDSESVAFLSRLLQFNTTNPPGDETECIRWIEGELAKDGIDSRFIESKPGRGNLVARLKASGPVEGKPLLMLGHVDVVPANAQEWSHPPFSGAVVNGEIWGRGALDMKGMVTTWTSLFRQLKRQGGPKKRDVVLMINADEEAGGIFGAQFMADNHWELIDCESALNEGGGSIFTINGKQFITYGVDEKRAARFKVIARGRPSHASRPHDDNALLHLAKAVLALGSTLTPAHIVESFANCIRAIAAHQDPATSTELLRALDPAHMDAALDATISDPNVRVRLRVQARNTIAPTILMAGSKINVIPSLAECSFDCRVLPGQGREHVQREVEAILGEAGLLDKVTIEPIEPYLPTCPSSPVEHPLVDSIRRALSIHAPGLPLIPIIGGGGTDSRSLRPRGVAAYGFYPYLADTPHGTVHGIDERMPIKQLHYANRVIWDVLADYVGVDI